MISKERRIEIDKNLTEEYFEDGLAIWRKNLTEEEARFVYQKERNFNNGIIQGETERREKALWGNFVYEKQYKNNQDARDWRKDLTEDDLRVVEKWDNDFLKENEEHYKAFASIKGNTKPTILYGNSPEEILGRLQSWNNARLESDKFITTNIGGLNTKNNEYEDYHKFDIQSGKDITPLYLKLPHLKKAEFTKLTTELKQKGAKYNGFSKKWYVTRESDLNKFANYLDFTKESEVQFKQIQAEAEKQTVKFGGESLQAKNHEEAAPVIKYKYRDKEYTKEQMDSINRGIKAKLSPEQIALFERPELSSVQMEEIRYSILDGLSVEQISNFAKEDFKDWQMDLCRIGMQHGITFTELQPILVENDKSWSEKRNQLNKMIKQPESKEKERIPENYLANVEMSTEQKATESETRAKSRKRSITSKLEANKKIIKNTTEELKKNINKQERE